MRQEGFRSMSSAEQCSLGLHDGVSQIRNDLPLKDKD